MPPVQLVMFPRHTFSEVASIAIRLQSLQSVQMDRITTLQQGYVKDVTISEMHGKREFECNFQYALVQKLPFLKYTLEIKEEGNRNLLM